MLRQPLNCKVISCWLSCTPLQISDKVAIDFERVRLDGGPLRVYNPWYDKGTLTGDTTCLLEGASLVTPVPEEDEGCESEVSLESTITKDLRDREPTSTKIQSVTATATSGRENFHVQTNGQTVTIRRRAPSNKVDRATSPSVSAHPMAGSTDRTLTYYTHACLMVYTVYLIIVKNYWGLNLFQGKAVACFQLFSSLKKCRHKCKEYLIE